MPETVFLQKCNLLHADQEFAVEGPLTGQKHDNLPLM